MNDVLNRSIWQSYLAACANNAFFPEVCYYYAFYIVNILAENTYIVCVCVSACRFYGKHSCPSLPGLLFQFQFPLPSKLQGEGGRGER